MYLASVRRVLTTLHNSNHAKPPQIHPLIRSSLFHPHTPTHFFPPVPFHPLFPPLTLSPASRSARLTPPLPFAPPIISVYPARFANCCSISPVSPAALFDAVLRCLAMEEDFLGAMARGPTTRGCFCTAPLPLVLGFAAKEVDFLAALGAVDFGFDLIAP